jgi:hypothetical protein
LSALRAPAKAEDARRRIAKTPPVILVAEYGLMLLLEHARDPL